MKKTLLLTTILLSGFSLFAQQLDGTYKNGGDSISFNNNKTSFVLSGFGGLSSAHAGEGTYELEDNYLFINTTDYSGDKTNFEIMDASRKDSCVVYMLSPQNYFIQGVLVETRNKSGKLVSGKVTGNDGMVIFTPCDKIKTISATSLGYNPISLDYTPGKDYRIRLAKNNIVENKTVVFKIDIIDEETISLLMLTDDLNIDKERNKELEKLEKMAQKRNKLDKRLKKVYVPYTRKN